jgi:hypothetical protein
VVRSHDQIPVNLAGEGVSKNDLAVSIIALKLFKNMFCTAF